MIAICPGACPSSFLDPGFDGLIAVTMVRGKNVMNVTPLRLRQHVSKMANQTVIDARFWSDQVVAVARNRDVDSFMRIYDYFVPRLHRYLLGLGLNEAQGQELVQETMLRLWRRADLFDPARASLSTWLFRIARNLYIDHARGEPAAWLSIEEGADWLDAQASSYFDHSAESFTDQASLKRAIDGLSAVQARLIRMSYFESKSHSEIAKELGMPLGSVKSHLRRAFSKLQSSMRSPL